MVFVRVSGNVRFSRDAPRICVPGCVADNQNHSRSATFPTLSAGTTPVLITPRRRGLRLDRTSQARNRSRTPTTNAPGVEFERMEGGATQFAVGFGSDGFVIR